MKCVPASFLLLCLGATPAAAVEGLAIAGPIGGSDIRSAQMPPPGVYGGGAALAARASDFVDGNGDLIPGLEDAGLTRYLGGGFLVYVPDVQILGGSVGVFGVLPYLETCGKLLANEKTQCSSGFGDPYFEVGWSRSFGHLRQSQFSGAYPIFEGLSVSAGFGVVAPWGDYDVEDAAKGISSGSNIYDLAPSAALTYTTPPILADGTELSAKVYWNNYLENPETRYRTGDLVNVDFALTERIGRIQAGITGFYATQIEDDKINGAAIAPDGRRMELFVISPVINIDVPEFNGALKIKGGDTIYAENIVHSEAITFNWFQKF